MELEKTVVWYCIVNDGCGAVYLNWFLTEEDAIQFEENQDEGFGESCVSSVETFKGSDIYKKAVDKK